ncbi:MAG: DsrE/DsrF/DrsH-like family protein [Desulfovibrionaceae bacterium]|nr:DsrE/DsrF/DrsH-like family protein [Desulfovibrionaceae bacterium]MBF0515263.1 DsrE/DsrF/DrsH-like family protein [Desulfovibrionaceae bacterium]
MTGQEDKTDKQSYTFICSRGTLDGAYPSLILGLNARRLGHDVSLFYTFMGINVVRKGYLSKLKFHPPGFLGAIPGMATLATNMMEKQIEEANIPSIGEIFEMAQLEGVKTIACKMTMDMMKIPHDDLVEGVDVMNAEQYLKLAGACAINMFT